MTKIKTSELQGPALDWAVAEAAECDTFTDAGGALRHGPDAKGWHPSSNWSQCGPLIEMFKVNIESAWREWDARARNGVLYYIETSGPTPLIAACRAIVAAKLGNEVDVPEELV